MSVDARFTIRLARREDVEALRQLIALSARVLGLRDYTHEQIEGALQGAWGVDTQLIEDGTYFIVEEDGDLVGCGGWSYRDTLFGSDTARDRNTSRIDAHTGAARIRAYFVHPEAVRRGVGSLILDRCEAEARKAGYSRLSLMATLPGVPFYEARGFSGSECITYDLPGGATITFLPMTKELH